MVGMKDYYLGHVSTADPAALPEVPITGACETCAISWFCGGRCLYSNIMCPWSEEQRKFVCETVENMYYGLVEVLPEVQQLLVEGHISLHDFAHTRYNGCEIIP
jgi:sulfatase maturation enzyme AslB (radical SAM superfamily)